MDSFFFHFQSKSGWIYHVNCLLADNSHEISSLACLKRIFKKKKKNSQNLQLQSIGDILWVESIHQYIDSSESKQKNLSCDTRFPTMWYMCDQQRLRSACAYAQSDQSLCLSLEYSMTAKLLTGHRLEFLRLIGGCTGWSECTLVKMPHCWKSHVVAQIH